MSKVLTDMNQIMQQHFERSKKYSEAQFHWQPTENEWSLQQVLLHIVQIQVGGVTVLGKQIEKLDALHDSKWKNTYRYILLKLALYSNKKFKAPKVVSNVNNDTSLDEIIRQWNTSFGEIEAMVSNFPKKYKDKLIFKHPVVGWLNLNQTLGFMIDHLNHHQKQIESLYSQLDSK